MFCFFGEKRLLEKAASGFSREGGFSKIMTSFFLGRPNWKCLQIEYEISFQILTQRI